MPKEDFLEQRLKKIRDSIGKNESVIFTIGMRPDGTVDILKVENMMADEDFDDIIEEQLKKPISRGIEKKSDKKIDKKMVEYFG